MSKAPKPKGAKNGKHRRASKKVHASTAGRAGDGPGGAGKVSPAVYTTVVPFRAVYAPNTQPIPYAGIRAGELIGHRLWWVIREGRGEDWICSIAHRRLWEPGETVYGDTNELVSSVFNEIYGGVYAFSLEEHLISEVASQKYAVWTKSLWDSFDLPPHLPFWFGWDPLEETRTFVSGTIKMWGDVVEHETGVPDLSMQKLIRSMRSMVAVIWKSCGRSICREQDEPRSTGISHAPSCWRI